MKMLALMSLLLGVAWLESQRVGAGAVKQDRVIEELVLRAQQWRNALRQREKGALVEFTWPEYREQVTALFGDRKSYLYRMLLAERGRIREMILATVDENVRVFEDAPMGDVRSFAVCYGASVTAFERPSDFQTLVKNESAERFCAYWVREPEGLFVSYTFGLPPKD